MKLGEKIRSARLNAGMTQTELAGDFITRNMLSQIENGLAMPSLQTALYIADKLGLDAGILFSDGDNSSVYFLTRKLPELKKAFAENDFDKCIELCSEESESCDEAVLILAESHLKKAYELFDAGRFRQALKHGDSAVKTASKTIYSSDSIKFKAELLEVMISSITPYLKQTKHKAEEKKFLINKFIEANGKKEFVTRQSEIEQLMAAEKYAEAEALIKELLKERTLGLPFEYSLYCALEVCYRELKDFENAYKYSKNAKEMFEEMQQ